MKKLTKILICLILCVFAFGLVGCGSKPIMHPDSNALVSSNGGLAVKKGEYLYFVNGYMSADSMTERDYEYTLGAIMVAKLDENGNPKFKEDGSLDAGNYAVLSNKLSGFEAVSLNIFGDYLYFTSPCQEDQNGSWAKGLVMFYRVKLDNAAKVEELYQTTSSILSEEESSKPEHAYYFDGKTVYLVVYEKASKQIVIVNTSDNSKTSIGDVNNTVMPTNNASQIVYVKNADEDGKFSVRKIDLASKNDVELGKRDKQVTIKFITDKYAMFEYSRANVNDIYLYYLPLTSTSIEDCGECWQSVGLMSKYYLSQDGNTIFGLRDNTILFKYNWASNPSAKPKSFAGETDTINLMGSTDTNIVYYVKDAENENGIVIKTLNFTGSGLEAKTIATIESASTTYFDVNDDYIYFYKTIGNHSYLHRLQINNNENVMAEQFIGVYLGEDVPQGDENN